MIFDWAGTVIDSGVFGPTVVFLELFKNEGVPITIDEARGPMGEKYSFKDVGYCMYI